MSTAQPIEVKKDGLRQMQDGTWKLSLTVHPNDMPTGLMTAPMGTRYGMALVEIGDDEQPVSGPGNSTGPEKPKRKPAETRAELARRLCGVVSFGYFMAAKRRFDEQDFAVLNAKEQYYQVDHWLKQDCGIQSKAKLNTDPEAAKRWDALYTEFQQATGRMAERIGG